MTKNKIKSIFSEQRVILALVIAVVVVVGPAENFV